MRPTPTEMRFLTAYPTLMALFVGFVVSTAAVGSEPKSPAIDDPQEVAELPPPSGPYPVGTVLYDWTDDSREEQWSTVPGKPRELMVQVWYPADSTRGHPTESYVPNFGRLQKSLNQDWPGMPAFKTHAALGAPLSLAKKRYPVLVFSHGMNSARFFYTALLEELASHGYIVAAIDHTYWGPGVALSRGRTVPYEDGMDALDRLTSDQIDQMMWAGVSVMVADEVFVENKIAVLDGAPAISNPFRNRLDLSRVGVVGHSMGGQAATRACLEYAVFKACACLDGLNPFFYLRPKPSRKPFVLLVNSTWGTAIISQSLAQRYLAAWSAPEVFVIRGTKHDSFDDLPLLNPEERAKAPSDPIKAHAVIAAIVVEFFDRSFGYANETRLSPDVLQDIMAVDLRKIADTAPVVGADPPR
ncbi:MAG: alpha/beta fold hydrolase [Terriglobales bacterium]